MCLVPGFQKNAEKKTNLFHLIVQISFQCEIIILRCEGCLFFISIELGSSAVSTVKTASISLDSFYEVSSGFVLYIYKSFIWLCVKYLCHWLLFLELPFKYAKTPWKLACRAAGNTVAGCFELFAHSQIVASLTLF